MLFKRKRPRPSSKIAMSRVDSSQKKAAIPFKRTGKRKRQSSYLIEVRRKQPRV